MSLRYTLYEQAARHQLDADATAELLRLAGLQGEPPALTRRMAQGLAIAATALGGLAVIFCVAANWDGFGRFGRFALVQSLLAVALFGAWRLPAARIPLSLLALLTIGGLLACVGQTYQTGADPWQLFAAWAVMGLPMCWGVRSDALWAPWILVVNTAAALWVVAMTSRWQMGADDALTHVLAWVASAAFLLPAHPALRRHTGAGNWMVRFGVTVLLSQAVWGVLQSVFREFGMPLLFLALVLAVGIVLLFKSQLWSDGYCAGAGIVATDILLLAGLYRVILQVHSDILGTTFMLCLATMALAYGSSRLLLPSRSPGGEKP
ncbi:DUF2157 domain-containing protein [Pseudoduganella ginsengisoli]|uniref:DUF2157 domain-containing protein n=1 Tax=Pseudoduganella ginsengisoli TaxID=1462440 RepID=A0A6L6PUU0_9BURK|nr:DUF2157 domain-containing protein [Pseudoduganella ginsengisoli]MTW00758.1 DUF2157 domain-containing protein [Pseudoduganella ginsengisoli]